ncbi:MAG: GNAT family N-acetyltransferase [Pseudomonadota bacterium]
MGSEVSLTQPDQSHVGALAALWHRGWHDGHAAVVPAALARLRTKENFAERLSAMLPSIRIAVSGKDILGFCAIKDDELYQLFVSAAARGTGVAQRLLTDGEMRIAAAGHEIAHLDCAIGNERAAQFYRKNGWILRGEEEAALETSEGPFALRTWVFEKRVGTPG